MKAENFLIIVGANIRMNYKYTLLPAIALLFVIPFIYGTENLDYLQSADCLERITALIGIPMFTPLIRQEHSRSLYETIAVRQVSVRFVVLLRIVFSMIGSILLIMAFEIYMRMDGCSFPFFPYAFRTLAACMALGFVGLLLSSIVQNTIGGYLCAFCFYCIAQTPNLGGLFRPVTNGIQLMLILFLGGIGLAVIYFGKSNRMSRALVNFWLKVKFCSIVFHVHFFYNDSKACLKNLSRQLHDHFSNTL